MKFPSFFFQTKSKKSNNNARASVVPETASAPAPQVPPRRAARQRGDGQAGLPRPTGISPWDEVVLTQPRTGCRAHRASHSELAGHTQVHACAGHTLLV